MANNQPKWLNCVQQSQILINEPMANHTSFKIGGPAKAIVIPQSVDEIRLLVNALRAEEYPVFSHG